MKQSTCSFNLNPGCYLPSLLCASHYAEEPGFSKMSKAFRMDAMSGLEATLR